MKKIAYITSGKIGIHRFTYNEIELLLRNNCEIILCLTQLNPGPWMPHHDWFYHVASKTKALIQLVKCILFKRGTINLLFHAYKKGVLSYFFIALSFYKDLEKSETKAVHCQMGDDKLYIGFYLKKFMNVPLSVTVHAHELYQRKVYDDKESIKELFSSCDKVVTISNFNAKILKNKFEIEQNKIEVMRLFPDIDNLNYVRNKIRILIVANWVEKKGYSVLLKALKKLNRKDYVLWVVGGPVLSDDSMDVEELVNKYDMKDQVAILGRQSSPLIDIILDSCDIFCLPSITDFYEDGNPSEREGIPVALMEAMAWGKPVIATNHAGNSELVKKILVEENNVDQLAESIEYLLNNPKEWKIQGVENERIINQNYSKSNINSLINIFNKID